MELNHLYQPKKNNSARQITSFLACLASFGVLCFYVLLIEGKSVDSSIIEGGLTSHSSFWHSFFAGISFLASKPVIISFSVLTILVLWLKERDYTGIFTILLFVVGGNEVNKMVKNFVKRERPLLEGIIVEGYSFPSGHLMVGLITYGLIVYFIWRYATRLAVKKTAFCLAFALLLLIGISRVILGEHYITDVLAGYCLGGALLLAAIFSYEKLYR